MNIINSSTCHSSYAYWAHPLATMSQSGYIVIWYLNSKGLPNEIYHRGIGNMLTKSITFPYERAGNVDTMAAISAL